MSLAAPWRRSHAGGPMAARLAEVRSEVDELLERGAQLARMKAARMFNPLHVQSSGAVTEADIDALQLFRFSTHTKISPKIQEMKTEIGNSPVKFAESAQLYSECPSSSSGGSLGEFGRGSMVKEFDEVVFNEELNVVHGPIETKFGYHLIYISQRSD